MDKSTIPPFYVGQEVVCLKTSNVKFGYQFIKGNHYKVADYFQCPVCKDWKIAVLEMPVNGVNKMCCIEVNGLQHCCGSSKYFAPIISTFQSISLTKVLELETPLISVN